MKVVYFPLSSNYHVSRHTFIAYLAHLLHETTVSFIAVVSENENYGGVSIESIVLKPLYSSKSCFFTYRYVY